MPSCAAIVVGVSLAVVVYANDVPSTVNAHVSPAPTWMAGSAIVTFWPDAVAVPVPCVSLVSSTTEPNASSVDPAVFEVIVSDWLVVLPLWLTV